ncbi:DUF1810 domain-containing protein [Sphingomonas sp. ABOLG]|jgi:uncharacterized protein (DUF1810 family)|uniref:DUF1810 domain-containing protein n=1 Tax=Sphingomonas sp. ABOLG TaxID=1985880 RepID=UPI000F7F1694|nr:DUF1810 domain-containing protein [Sphingomonas sp. ABOLG]RSV14540.1 DUF1810 domain-containing protein [Sphingomonas sp. ABOLG]
MDDPFDLDRFVTAQHGSYADALTELRHGRKTSHWMWYVFPQLRGLGHSPTAQHFGIASLDEARAYLAHPLLGPRLHAACAALATASGSAVDILGPVDAMKLRSSMTLFARAADDPAPFQAIIDRFFDGPDPATHALLPKAP